VKAMATIIFDFDDTLFDTARLKDDIFSLLSRLGISRDVILETYIKSQDKYGNYTPDAHFMFLRKHHNLSDEILTVYKSINFSTYLFTEVLDLLNALHSKYKLVLLTKGNPDFQNTKISSVDISHFFHETSIVLDTKENFLCNYATESPIYFVNDKENENKKIANLFPHFKIINKKHGEQLVLTMFH
jgi:FMN phosphatase YigB (HAD superfamily)